MLVLGFGEAHRQTTKSFCNTLADLLAKSADGTELEAARQFAEQAGTYKDKGWRIAALHRCLAHRCYEGAKVIVVEGEYSHYRDDHPMSTDGYACLEMQWCITVCIDDSWGTRTYIAM